MKKLKMLQLALSLAMLIAISTTNSFADTKTKFAPIVDASQMNMAAVNRLSAVKPEGGNNEMTVGGIIVWMYENSPPDEVCSDIATGGNGASGICKWLECNGQSVDPSLYPDYALVATNTPDFVRRSLIGRKETDSSSTKLSENISFDFNFSVHAAWGQSPDGHNDGVVGFRTGTDSSNLNGVLPPASAKVGEIRKHEGKLAWSMMNQIPMRYLIRVSK